MNSTVGTLGSSAGSSIPQRGGVGVAVGALLLLALFATSSAFAGDWTIRGFGDKELYALAIDPAETSTIYAATWDGVYKSANSGNDWRMVRAKPRGHVAAALVIEPYSSSTIYMVELSIPRGAILLKSTDSGENWLEVPTDLPVEMFRHLSSRYLNLHISPNRPAPDNPTVLYLIVYTQLWSSTDGGLHWHRIAHPESPIVSLAIDPINSRTLYLGTQTLDAKKSTDGGKVWRPLSVLRDSLPIFDLKIDPANPAIVYAGTSDGIYKSTNGGENWTLTNAGIEIGGYEALSPIAIDPLKSSNVYAIVHGRVYKSIDTGMSWTEINGLSGKDVRQLVVDPKHSNRLYAGTNKGVWVIDQ